MNDAIPVLDKGFVRLEKHSGEDPSVVRAARVSYGSKSKTAEADRKLIRYMLEHEHGTPFEHNLFTFHVKAPIFVFRQWHRTRIGISYNELSARYAEMKDEFYFPKKWRKQDVKDKQNSIAGDLPHAALTRDMRAGCKEQMARYRRALKAGAAREMARFHLPVNLYSEMYFTCNARSLMAFIKLRSEHHAQWETRQYSNALWTLFAKTMPWTAEAFLGTLPLARYQSMDGLAGPNLDSIPKASRAA
ncbi:MAG: FAD-dependent thymidylate synthase [Sphingomonadales bacterium]|nr:FAD-dependent thymidylate synthase [Sphingomonadaceae bacterium]MBS3930383.1 FAD-dependent thymidylate synthase [Sphingomonadales bacterium]